MALVCSYSGEIGKELHRRFHQNAKVFAEYLSNGSMGSDVKKQRRGIDRVVIIKSAGKKLQDEYLILRR